MPHTLTSAILYRARIDSAMELPKEKRPPRNLWDKPYRFSNHMEHIWDTKEGGKSTQYIEFNEDDIE